MADIFNIALRRISGTGIIQISADDLKLRRYTLFADIIRRPLTPYYNGSYEPSQTFYAHISLVFNDYLLQTLSMQYNAQIWSFDADISGQNLVAIKCEYLGILKSFANLGTALGLTVVSVENTIADYKYLPLPWNKIIIKCEADCAIQFALVGLPYDVCQGSYIDPSVSPIAPAKPTPVLPGVPTEISPPYPGDTISKKTPLDETYTPPPTGNTCEPGLLKFKVKYFYDNQVKTDPFQIGVYGKVGTVGKIVGSTVQIQHQGYTSGGGCVSFDYREVASLSSLVQILDVIDITFPA